MDERSSACAQHCGASLGSGARLFAAPVAQRQQCKAALSDLIVCYSLPARSKLRYSSRATRLLHIVAHTVRERGSQASDGRTQFVPAEAGSLQANPMHASPNNGSLLLSTPLNAPPPLRDSQRLSCLL